MIKRFLEYIQKNGLIRQGETVCAGVSGGADSVCLLIMLDEIKDRLGFSLSAFHVDHNLRGEESRADRDYTIRLCEERGIPIRVFSYDISSLSEKWKKGTEETGRICRKEAAEKMLSEGCDRIALAHHMNDQAETVLFNLSRGSSLKGLAGIKPSSGKVIHPLLIFSKKEIEGYLLNRDIAWRTDSTNSDTDYTRNRIRHELVPLLESVNAGAVRHVFYASEDLYLADRMITELAKDRMKSCVFPADNGFYISGDIMKENALLRGYILREALKDAGSTLTDLSRTHIESIFSLFDRTSGRKTMLPSGISAVRNYDRIHVSTHKDEAETGKEEAALLCPEATVFCGQYKITAGRAEPFAEDQVFSDFRCTKTFDYDTIKNARFRKTQKGDYIVTCKDGGKKKLSRFFKDIKLSEEQRKHAVVLAYGSEVFWVLGGRMGESAKVSKDTKETITIEVIEL